MAGSSQAMAKEVHGAKFLLRRSLAYSAASRMVLPKRVVDHDRRLEKADLGRGAVAVGDHLAAIRRCRRARRPRGFPRDSSRRRSGFPHRTNNICGSGRRAPGISAPSPGTARPPWRHRRLAGSLKRTMAVIIGRASTLFYLLFRHFSRPKSPATSPHEPVERAGALQNENWRSRHDSNMRPTV